MGLRGDLNGLAPFCPNVCCRSCTIWIDDRPRCIHDGGVWYNCPGGPEVEDFIGTICTAYWSRTGAWAEECTDSRVRMEAMMENTL